MAELTIKQTLTFDFDNNWVKNISRGENQKGISDISPTLQESQNKNVTMV